MQTCMCVWGGACLCAEVVKYATASDIFDEAGYAVTARDGVCVEGGGCVLCAGGLVLCVSPSVSLHCH